MALVDIIIPTFNNYDYLFPCLQSLLTNKSSEGLFHVYVVNNGDPQSCDWIDHKDVTVIQTGGENLRWEGGLKKGLEYATESPYVLFYNDDTHIPASSRYWIHNLLQNFRDPTVGAVGPSSNVVMGWQSIFANTPILRFETKLLIGFCYLVRREALEKADGVDDSLPGGDDFDLSIRIRDAGYKLICDKNVFVLHHGFKTGNRVHGDQNVVNGWNSYEFKEKADFALIRKHGFAKWTELMESVYQPPKVEFAVYEEDREGNLIRERILGDRVVDVGCGGNKTIEGAIGIDFIKDEIATLGGVKSQADIIADVSGELPIADVDTIVARHILEHMANPVRTLKAWKQSLNKHGRLIIAVPDNSRIHSVPMNIEHTVGYTKELLADLLKLTGYTVLEQLDSDNGVSFITVAEAL